MMSISCGLAATGKVPYASTFAIFASSRSYDQVRLGIAHNELKVRIGASHGGVSLGEDGASHQMIEDIALMRAMPKMQVIVPADYNQAYTATHESFEREGPIYMRFGRPSTPIVYDEIAETLGDGVDVLRQGKDISIFACGHMVWRALDAAQKLEREDGIEAEVVNVAIIKPLASKAVLESLAKTGVAVTAEEHRVTGGLGDAIRQVAAEQHPVPVFALGMGDEFGVSGTAEACMEHFGLTSTGIIDLVREAMVKKPLVQHPPIRGSSLD
jgi:transketolase